jgi:hypothetical protein
LFKEKYHSLFHCCKSDEQSNEKTVPEAIATGYYDQNKRITFIRRHCEILKPLKQSGAYGKLIML